MLILFWNTNKFSMRLAILKGSYLIHCKHFEILRVIQLGSRTSTTGTSASALFLNTGKLERNHIDSVLHD